ncbi:MAG: hypothetical protein JHC84_14640 [Solirubrobacteraceae bacterium]|nr:hypothetical protein [Solirubrobacteraceae bacterium]
MNATPAPDAAFGGSPVGGPKVIRSIGACFGWLLLSFGLWGFAWIYNTLTEIGRATGKDTQAGLRTVLYIIPIVNIFVLYMTWKDISEFAEASGEEGFSPILYIILSFIPIVNIFIFISVQNKLNATWMRASNGSAQKAELETLEKVLIGVGAVIWVFYIGIIVLAGALSS